MVILERHEQVNAELDQLLRRRGGAGRPPVSVEIRPIGPEEAATLLAAVRPAFEARPPLDPPAATLTETVESLAELLASTGRAARHGSTASRSAGWCSTRSGPRCTSAGSACCPALQGHGIAARLIAGGGGGGRGLRRPDRRRADWSCRGRSASGSGAASGRSAATSRTSSCGDRSTRSSSTCPTPTRCASWAARSPGSCGPATWSCSAASSAPARPPSPRGSAPGSTCAGRITSPTFVIARVHPSLGRRAGAGPRRRLPARRDRRARRPRPRHLARRRGDGGRVGRGDRRGAGRVAAGAADDPGAGPRRRARGPRPAPGADDAGRAPLVRAGGARHASARRWPRSRARRCWSTSGPVAEDDLRDLDPRRAADDGRCWSPEHDGRVLLVHNVRTAEWELPLARLGRTASPRARRRSSNSSAPPPARDPGEVAFAGVATVQHGHQRRIKRVAVFRGRLPEVGGLRGDVGTSTAWPGGTRSADHAGLSPIDAHLVRAARVEG